MYSLTPEQKEANKKESFLLKYKKFQRLGTELAELRLSIEKTVPVNLPSELNSYLQILLREKKLAKEAEKQRTSQVKEKFAGTSQAAELYNKRNSTT